MKIPLLSALLLVLGLCGCDRLPGNEGSPRAASNAGKSADPVVAPAPAAAPAPPIVQVVDIVEALAGVDGTAREVLPEGLELIEAGMSCSLDSVNLGTPGFAVTSAEPLFLSGWFAHPTDIAARLVAVLRGERTYAYVAEVAALRPDVAEAIGTREQVSDYRARGDIAAVAPGEYAVYLVRTDGGGALAKCVADQKITVVAQGLAP